MRRIHVRSDDLIISGSLTPDFCSSSRRRNRRIASYATVSTTRKTDKKTSQNPDIIKSSLLSVHLQNEEPQKATRAWVKAFQIAKKIDLVQALDALENLAKNLDLDDGLEGWEKLARNDDSK